MTTDPMVIRSSALAVLLLALAACNAAPVTGNSVVRNEKYVTPTASEAMQALPEAEQRARAFKAVFGKAEPVEGEEGFSTKAGKLIWQGDRAVLMTVTEADEEAGACHACSGSLGIYYLADEGDGFRVMGKFPEAVPGNGFGGAPSEWSISDKFGPVPVIYSEAGWTGQGVTCTNFRLTELRTNKPVEVANVPIYYDDSESGSPLAKGGQIEGKFGEIVPGKSFTIHYKGFMTFDETWRRGGNGAYQLANKTRMPTC